jgi:hypothetical protein
MQAIIVDTGTDAIDGAWRTEMLDWARSLGLDTNLATARFVLIKGDQGWRACFSLKRQRDGHDYIDQSAGRLAVDYGVAQYDVPEGLWPRWFGQPFELPEMPAEHLLDVLAASGDAAWALRDAARSRGNDVWGEVLA